MHRLSLGLAIAAMLLSSSPAAADSSDFELYRLGDPSIAGSAADNNFRIFANQLGASISSLSLSPPATLGHSAFAFALEYGVTKLDTSSATWPRAGSPPTDMLLIPSLHVRKGLPFSFELGSRFSYLQFSNMAAATLEAKWALNEGFLYFPDLAVRGYGTRLLGARDFSLTTAGVDLAIGKKIGLGGMLTLTPYAGWGLVLINCTSNVIDFKPDRSASEGLTGPTDNTGVFTPVTMLANSAQRYSAGLRLIAYVVEFGAEFSVTKTYGNKQVMTIGSKLGLDF